MVQSRQIGADCLPSGTYLNSGAAARAGRTVNRFCDGLRMPENRAAFMADREACMQRYDLDEADRELIRGKDWLGFIKRGANVFPMLRLADWDPDWRKLLRGYEPMQDWLRTHQPDAAILVDNDDVTTFFFDLYPTFALSVSGEHRMADAGFGPRPLAPIPAPPPLPARSGPAPRCRERSRRHLPRCDPRHGRPPAPAAR